MQARAFMWFASVSGPAVRAPNVNTVTVQIPSSLPAAIVRPREHIEAVLAQSLREMGDQGRTALAWAWALTGSRPSRPPYQCAGLPLLDTR